MCLRSFRQLINILSLSCFCVLLNAQAPTLDSLETELENAVSDSSKIDLLLQLSGLYFNKNVEKSLSYSRQASSLASVNNFIDESIQSKLQLAQVLELKGNVDSSFVFTREARKLALEQKDSLHIVNASLLLAKLHTNRDEKKEALDLFRESISIAERNNYDDLLITTYGSFARYLMGTQDEKGAISYLWKAYYLAEKSRDENKMTSLLVNLSIGIDDIDTSLMLLNQAHDLAIKNSNTRALSFIYDQQAYYYSYQGEREKALESSRKAYQVAEKMGATQKQQLLRLDLARYHQELDDLDSAASYFEAYLEKMDSIQNFQYVGIRAYRDFSKVKLKQGYKNEAFEMLDSSYTLMSTLYSENLKEEVSDANVKYETKEKEALLAQKELEIIRSQSQKNKITWIAISLLLAAGGLFFYVNERQKRKQNELTIDLKKKELEAKKLFELDGLKKHFFTNITHELRTPLSLIIGPLSSALEKVDEKKSKDYILLAKTNAHRLLDMVNEIMDLSKIESGHVEVIHDTVNLNSFCKRNLFSFHSSAELRNIDLKFESEVDDDIIVSVDIEKTETIFNNLISNAIKFSPEGEKIVMRTSLEGNRIKVALQDHGEGVLPEDRPYVFDRFYQSPLNVSSSVKGSGIGLSLSKTLSSVLGGELTLEDSVRGSLFVLSLPSLSVERQEQTHLEDEANSMGAIVKYQPLYINGEKPHLLVIEDNSEMRLFLEDILSEDYRVTTAKDGYDGFQKIQNADFDLISCDVMMPKMDGFSLRSKLNGIPKHMQTPFVFLTARSLEEDRIKGLRLGVDDYLVKPFVKQEYLARIHNLLSNKIARAESGENYGEFHKSYDDEILHAIEKKVLEKIDDPHFTVNELAQSMHYSQRQLSRIMKTKTGMTSVQFILELRMQRAHHLLKSKRYTTIKEVQYAVGIDSSSYFTRKFKERFGINASDA